MLPPTQKKLNPDSPAPQGLYNYPTMHHERIRFVVKIAPNAREFIDDMFPSPSGEYVSVRNTNPNRMAHLDSPVNTVLYRHNGSYVPVQWKVHRDFTHIQLYWWPHNRVSRSTTATNQLRSGDFITIIRPVFRTLFWAIIKLKLLLRRIRIRLVIRNAMRRQTTPNTLTIFSGNVNYPIQRRILECI